LIETVMLLLLGFLAAMVLWLLALPALHRRADRLARRRAELTFPLSMAEVSAERDHVRAEFAVRQRDIERKAEAAAARSAAALGELGARDMTISDLKGVAAAREIEIARLNRELTATTQELGVTRIRLGAEEAEHVRTRDELSTRIQILADRDKEIGELRVIRADLTADLSQRISERDEARARGEALDRSLAELSGAHDRLQREHALLGDEKDRLRIELADSQLTSANRAAEIEEQLRAIRGGEQALAAEQGAHGVTQAALASREGEFAKLAKLRDGLAAKLAAAEAAGDAVDARLKQMKTERDTVTGQLAELKKDAAATKKRLDEANRKGAKLEIEGASATRAASLRIAALEADNHRLAQQLGEAKADRAAVRAEVSQLRRASEQAAARIEAENALLRGEIMKVAEGFLGRMAQTAAPQPVIPRRPAANSDEPKPAVRAAGRKPVPENAAE
jgi:hypothetical protein